MLERYFCPKDWHRVRFNDKIYFGYGTQNELKIISKPDIRYCQNYIKEMQKPNKKNKKRYQY